MKFRHSHYKDGIILDIHKNSNKYGIYAKMGNYFPKLKDTKSDGGTDRNIGKTETIRIVPSMSKKMVSREHFTIGLNLKRVSTKDTTFYCVDMVDTCGFFDKYIEKHEERQRKANV